MQAETRTDARRASPRPELTLRLLHLTVPLALSAILILGAQGQTPPESRGANDDPQTTLGLSPTNSLPPIPQDPAPSQRVRMHGTVTLRTARGLFYLQDDHGGILVNSRRPLVMNPGDRVDVVGSPRPHRGHWILADATVQRTGKGQLPSPLPLKSRTVLNSKAEAEAVHARRVEVNGRLLEIHPTPTGYYLHMQQEVDAFLGVRLDYPKKVHLLDNLPPGSRIQVAGVCLIELDPLQQPMGVEVLLDSPDSLTVVETPGWWTTERLQTMLAGTLALAAVVLAWVVTLRRRVRRQTRLIRERLESEAALRRQFELFMQNIPGPVYIKDPQGRYLYANAAWEEQFPGRRTHWRGRTDGELWPEAIARARIESDQAALASPQTLVNVESDTDLHGGLRYWISHKFRMGEPGQPAEVGGILLDITARQRTEEALRQSQDLLAKAFHASPAAIAISSRNDHRLVDANASCARLLGVSREQLLGRTWIELAAWEEMASWDRILQTAAQGKAVHDAESRLRSHEGSVRNVLTSVEPIELGQEPCLLWIFYDETDRLALQAQLRQAQKMESIGQLAAGVAHDFNNILTIIHGYASLLENLLAEHPETHDPLRQIAAAADRAANLTRQLLTFSRRQVMQPQTVDLNDIIRNLSKMLQRMLGEDIALECTLAPTILSLHADAGMLEQVLMNLAVNARDAMPKGGQLAVRSDLIQIDGEHASRNPEARSGRFIRLTVIDTGCGMDAATLARIFEPFFTTKEIGKGTGLGLATVYGIVKQHRGWIEVESEPGRGTQFRIYLPPKDTASAPALATPPAPSSITQGKGTVLLVEDEPSLRALARQVLERSGYRVVDAETGRGALELWQAHGPQVDLLLTDIVMPEGVSGRELAQRLGQEKPSLKILYTSGYSTHLVGNDFALAQGTNFIQKPYTPGALTEAVARCLNGSSAPAS